MFGKIASFAVLSCLIVLAAAAPTVERVDSEELSLEDAFNRFDKIVAGRPTGNQEPIFGAIIDVNPDSTEVSVYKWSSDIKVVDGKHSNVPEPAKTTLHVDLDQARAHPSEMRELAFNSLDFIANHVEGIEDPLMGFYILAPEDIEEQLIEMYSSVME